MRGSIDGEPLRGSQLILPGTHTVQLSGDARGRIALIWAQAAERGFTPFYGKK